MSDPFVRLEERVAGLGNHHRRYLRNISVHKDALIDRLESLGKIDQVHLWSASPDLANEMDTVIAAGRHIEEQLSFLGCYYALQFLNMNIRAIDILALNLETADDRYTVYREFMRQIGNEFRALTAHHMEKLLELILAGQDRPGFVICGVGTRADQDDIDVGIIDDGSPRRHELNVAISRLHQIMFKQAVPLHFYLSEHVGSQSYSASISEYNDLLRREIHDFVIISEMLWAAPIIGSASLFRAFRRDVIQRYYYHHHGDNRYHEGYLRGLLGEVQSLLLRKMKTGSINPKEDGLRMIKNTLFAGKTIFHIRKINAWDIITSLEVQDQEHREIMHTLDRSLTFLEIFRFLYQLFVVQEDEIPVAGEHSASNLQDVAKAMGYKDIGVIRAWDHLLIHYHEHVAMIKRPIETLLNDTISHLKDISVFNQLFERSWSGGEGNLAVDFIETSHFFRGTKFWDDCLESLEADDGALLEQLVRDYNVLDAERRKWWIAEYAEWSNYAFMVIMRFLVDLDRKRRQYDSRELFAALNTRSLEVLDGSPDVVQRLTRIFNYYPELVHAYLLTISEQDQSRFITLLQRPIWEDEVAHLRDQLLGLCRLHFLSNRYFKRSFQSLLADYPEYIHHLDDTDRLKEMAKGLCGKVDHLQTFRAKKNQLAHYHDVEFFRVGLKVLAGDSFEEINTEFTEFSDTYLQTLFDVCKQEVEQERGEKMNTKDLLAIFTAGGHAREQAFDDDHDLIVLLNSDDAEMRRTCTAIISKMNSELVRRGTLPHYRFADRFGHYVTLFSELSLLFQAQTEDTFIDQSQILGARMVVGSRRFKQAFNETIIRPFIFGQNEPYIRQMIREVSARHAREEKRDLNGVNIKEDRGGLRDIEMVMLMYKASLHIHTPVTARLFGELAGRIPDRGLQFHRLGEMSAFLKRLRDIYRLTTSADDTLVPADLDRVLSVVAPQGQDGLTNSKRLTEKLSATMSESWGIISGLMAEILPSLAPQDTQKPLSCPGAE